MNAINLTTSYHAGRYFSEHFEANAREHGIKLAALRKKIAKSEANEFSLGNPRQILFRMVGI